MVTIMVWFYRQITVGRMATTADIRRTIENDCGEVQ